MARGVLNDLTLRTLNVPAGQRVEIWDQKLPGFGLRAGNRSKTFILVYRQGEASRRMTIGRYPALSLAEARTKALAALGKLANKEDPQPATVPPREVVEFSAVVEDFLKRYAAEHTRASSQAQSARVLRGHFGKTLHRRDIAAITKQDVQAVLDGLVESERPIAANNARVVAGRFFNWCVERGLIEDSPVAGIKRPARPSSRERVLAEVELAAVWRAAIDVGYPIGSIVQLLILTAQRRNEVAGLRRAHLDLQGCLWHLPLSITKNHRSHTIPLSRSACELLERLPRIDDELVFPSLRGSDRSFSGFGKSKARLDEVSGVDDWTLHDLRRTAATHMARLKVGPHVVERILNHVSGSLGGVAGIYNRFSYLPEMREALELWSHEIARLAGVA
jgi:integrase